ncbi:MAG: hypothetical protein AAGE01_09430 [Pseudomonadota bacterium]
MYLKPLFAAALLTVFCSSHADPSHDPVGAATPLELEALGPIVDAPGGAGHAAALLALQEIARQLQQHPEQARKHVDAVMKLSLLRPVDYPPGIRIVEPIGVEHPSSKTVSECVSALQLVTHARSVADAICATSPGSACAGALVSVAAAATSAFIACSRVAYELQ